MYSLALFRFVGEASANNLDKDTMMGIAEEALRLNANLAGGIVDIYEVEVVISGDAKAFFRSHAQLVVVT
jgi:hypothetical protein